MIDRNLTADLTLKSVKQTFVTDSMINDLIPFGIHYIMVESV